MPSTGLFTTLVGRGSTDDEVAVDVLFAIEVVTTSGMIKVVRFIEADVTEADIERDAEMEAESEEEVEADIVEDVVDGIALVVEVLVVVGAI